MPRMNILSKEEQKEFDTSPVFNARDRKRYFSFSNSVLDKANTFRKTETRIGFLLSYGYFKASSRFFDPKDYHKRDIDFVSERIGSYSCLFKADAYDIRTRQRHNREIRNILGYRKINTEEKEELYNKIEIMIRQYLKPRLIFHYCIEFFRERKIQLSSYFEISGSSPK